MVREDMEFLSECFQLLILFFLGQVRNWEKQWRFKQLFRVLPNFHEYYINFLETRKVYKIL